MELQGFSLIILLTECLFNFEGAQAELIWRTPNDIGEATGSSSVKIEIDEDAASGDTVYTFLAASNGQTIASYDLVTSESPFSFTSSTDGVLKVSGDLDYETTPSYVLVVTATDDSDPVKMGTATVTVTVTDVNEGTPTFMGCTYTVCVATEAAVDTIVTNLTATDTDTNNTITYSIDSGDTNNDFKFTADKLLVAKQLDLETTETYTLIIYATDDGTPKKTGTATVDIKRCASENEATKMTVTFCTLLLAFIVTLL